MANKRQATTDLNHENWDQEDPSEQEDMGTFTCAPKEVLEKRVIRTAKRRAPSQSSSDEVKKSVFSSFGGFNKVQPSTFDFLANLTNGNKTTNGSNQDKSEPNQTSGLFSSKPASSSPNASFFNMPVTTATPVKPMFNVSTTQSTLFSSSTTNTTSPFAAKTQPVSGSPFNIQNQSIEGKSATESPKNVFGIIDSNINKSPFSANAGTTAFKTASLTTTPTTDNSKNEKPDDEVGDKKLAYYSKLKGLNESVSDWIKKHVEETPLCILSPIFKDYDKYLKEIQDEYQSEEKTNKGSENSVDTKSKTTGLKETSTVNMGSPIFPNTDAKSIFGGQNIKSTVEEKTSGFSFGISSVPQTTSGGFSFGSSTTATTGSSLFSTTTSTNSTVSTGAAPFSFGIGKPFSFSSNVQKPVETNETTVNEEEEEPPKVEYKPIAEENSVFEKKVKIFVKIDGNFADKGVGTLYIKSVDDSDKYQLLVRANTSLGTVLLNLILSSGIPLQRLGKNNVMMICIPTPELKPPPTSVLIRVKTSEEADDLLETLNKYKV